MYLTKLANKNMDDIQGIVQKVARQCASRGISVSEVLAAFVAKTASALNLSITLMSHNNNRRDPLHAEDEFD